MKYLLLEGNVFVAKTTTAKSKRARAVSADTETVAQILERERNPLIQDWLALVEKQEDLMAIPYEDRTAHLPRLLADVIARLRLPFLHEGFYLTRRRSSRRSATQTGLLRGHARGGVANIASVPLHHSAQKRHSAGL